MVIYAVFFWWGCWGFLTFRSFLLFWDFFHFICYFSWLICFSHSLINYFTSAESGFRHVWFPFFIVAVISVFSQGIGANCVSSFKDFKWSSLGWCWCRNSVRSSLLGLHKYPAWHFPWEDFPDTLTWSGLPPYALLALMSMAGLHLSAMLWWISARLVRVQICTHSRCWANARAGGMD